MANNHHNGECKQQKNPSIGSRTKVKSQVHDAHTDKWLYNGYFQGYQLEIKKVSQKKILKVAAVVFLQSVCLS